ncbi:MAG: CBS domain-containing protein [Endomicrobia bacterium]|nr:CBS domain-containing protein [Endomicrobiia bacterium]
MLKAKDLMTKDVITVKEETSVLELAKILYENKISGVPVVDENRKVVGVVTERDILSIIFSGNVQYTKVADIMTKKVIKFSPETDIDKIALAISEHNIRRVVIVDENDKVVGIISRRDIIKMILNY